MAEFQKITPCLWFDDQAEPAARFYTSVFENGRILGISHYGEAGHEIHGREAGSVMTVEFELAGQRFTALNGGPLFRFNEAISLQIDCADQAETDYFWARLSDGGDPAAQQCGWLKDRYGLSWQVIPRGLVDLLSDADRGKADRAMNAMLQMKKLDIDAIRRACAD